MKRPVVAIFCVLLSVASLMWLGHRALATGPQEQPPAQWQREIPVNEPVFSTLEITIDPEGKPLGAFQFELTSTNSSFTVVGVEGGEHAAFDHGRPPYFDLTTQRVNTDRLVLAEYALPDADSNALPTGPIRVATVHIMLEGTDQIPEPIQYAIKVTAAGDADGNPIDATASYRLRNPERIQ